MMEKENELMYSEMKNPIFQALEDQLRLEFEWAYADKNLYSISMIALYLIDLSNEDFKKIETLVYMYLKKIEETKLNSFLTTEFILGLCFATKVIYNRKRRISAKLLRSLSLLLNEAKKRDWLNNNEFASLVLTSLSSINEFDELLQAATLWVVGKYQEFIKNRNYEGAIDCLYGLRFRRKDLQLSMDDLHELIKQIDKISDETLAKLCILLKGGYEEIAVMLVGELERRLEDEFRNLLMPSLERGLREITSLLNSGYPLVAIKSIIEAKKREGHSWAKDIIVEENSITIRRIPKLNELSKIDPKAHAFALKALDLYNRSYLVKLTKEEFQKLNDAYRTTKIGYIGVRKKEYWIILFITGITSFFTIIFLPDILMKISGFDYQHIIVLIQEAMKDWTKLFVYGLVPGLLFWFWIWLIRILYILRRGGEISIPRLFQLLPIIGDIIRKVLPAEKGDTQDG
jgi:hypothetical protein